MSEKIGKSTLVALIADKTGQPQSVVKEIINAATDTIAEQLAKGNEVSIVGFGTFRVVHRDARKGRNPQTGEDMDIPAANVPRFTPGKGLKEAVS